MFGLDSAADIFAQLQAHNLDLNDEMVQRACSNLNLATPEARDVLQECLDDAQSHLGSFREYNNGGRAHVLQDYHIITAIQAYCAQNHENPILGQNGRPDLDFVRNHLLPTWRARQNMESLYTQHHPQEHNLLEQRQNELADINELYRIQFGQARSGTEPATLVANGATSEQIEEITRQAYTEFWTQQWQAQHPHRLMPDNYLESQMVDQDTTPEQMRSKVENLMADLLERRQEIMVFNIINERKGWSHETIIQMPDGTNPNAHENELRAAIGDLWHHSRDAARSAEQDVAGHRLWDDFVRENDNASLFTQANLQSEQDVEPYLDRTSTRQLCNDLARSNFSFGSFHRAHLITPGDNQFHYIRYDVHRGPDGRISDVYTWGEDGRRISL